ncbi:MAG: hypothetical protein R3223_02300 [Longimicrobiales bacterium]|nr:hypothetical protein [Longimicrobiales bacterium]
MAAADSESPALRKKLNRLYWSSDRSVNQIADDLGISKGTLYEVVEPAGSGLSCPDCGEQLVYPNRTARDRGSLTCPACDLEVDQEEVDDRFEGSGASRHERSGGVPYPASMRGEGKEALTRIVAGTALLGVAAGIVLVKVLRKS